MNWSLKGTLVSVVATSFATLSLPGFAQTQQNFPTKPIRLLVPSSPGSQPDTLARMIGAKMSESWGQAVVVDNRPGAGGTLAASTVAKAAPDGHTLLLLRQFCNQRGAATEPPLRPAQGLRWRRPDRVWHAVLVVAPALGVKSVKDLIALAKAQPGKIIFGSSGVRKRDPPERGKIQPRRRHQGHNRGVQGRARKR